MKLFLIEKLMTRKYFIDALEDFFIKIFEDYGIYIEILLSFLRFTKKRVEIKTKKFKKKY
jgi:hypothetical protein